MALKRLALASAVTAILAGCGADDQSYDYVERDNKEIQVKDLKDGRWFYVPTTGAAPRFALNQFPFLQGMGRYVELCFTETGLEVRAFDKNYPDSSLPKDQNNYCVEQDNLVGSDDLVNFAQVLEIPGDFAAYRCSEDAYDDCTNKEEINNDASLDFRKKTHFTPNPEDLIVSEFNYEDLFGLTDGISEQGTPTLVSWEFDPKSGVLNFELERTFRVDLDNITDYINFGTKAGLEEALVDGAFKSRFYYSLVHESVVASEDYQPVLYPVGDENDIGFFTTATKKLNPITNKYDRDVVYLNRFNPDESIKYYLTDNFFEEKNKIFLDATLETVNKMNQALSLFGSDSGKPPIEIVNPSAGAGVHPGDLRYNIINLVDEPLANGLLGYGPSVGNPMTGEIIKAHVNQYSGVARTGVPYYWDNLARFYNRNQLDLDGLDPLPTTSSNVSKEVSNRLDQLSTMAAISKLESQNSAPVAPNLTKEEVLGDKAPIQEPTILQTNFNDDMDFEDVVAAEENRLAYWAENNAYPIEASWVSSSNKAMLDNLELDDERYFDISFDDNDVEVSRELKRWKYLPKDLKQTVADAITVATYSNTLVHEIGHNVGLRHNFKGSNDKENYYTLEQAHALGLNNIPAYSSTMDYAPSMLDETPTWGLYDIAAFKFGYGRIVETIQDSSTSAPAVVAQPPQGAPAEEVAAYEQYEADLEAYQQSFAYRFGNHSSNDSLMVCSEVVALDGAQAGKSLYNCDFNRFDTAALSDNVEDYAKTRYGVLYYLDNVHDIERKSYDFCTDGNVSLNSDCNRFDEGTTLDEIVSYEWQNYLDSYDRRNLAEYSTNGLFSSDYPSYIVRRFREMTSIRDKMEDLERIDNIYTELGYTSSTDKPGDFLLSLAANDTYCKTAGDATNSWFCDYAYGAQKSAAYFLDVLATPEHQCVIQNGDGNQKVISLGQLLNNSSFNIPADYDLIDADCFDPVATEFIEDAESGYVAVAETKNGRFLNSIGSFDPDYPWSNAVSVLGSWPDKALASYFLSRRFSTRYTDEVSFASLMDIPGVQAEYENIMANIVANTGLNNPVELVDKEGNAYSSLNGVEVNLHITEQMESLSPMPKGIERFLDISNRSRQRIGDLILNMGVRQMQSDDYTVKSRGKAQFDAFTKQQDRYGIIAGDKVEFVIDGKTFVATKSNKLAYAYANQLVTSDGYDLKVFLDNYDSADLTAVANSIDTAWGSFRTSIIPAYHDAVLLFDSPMVNAMKANIDADIAAGTLNFSQSFNNFVNANIGSGDLVYDAGAGTIAFAGGKVHDVNVAYSGYTDAMELIYFGYTDAMMAAVDNVYAGYDAASAQDKELWTTDLNLIQAYLTGDISAVAGEYYELLDRLPNAADFE